MERVDIEYENMTVRLKKGQVILDDVSGRVRSGRLTAIMGPSGKSTVISENFVEFSSKIS